MCLIPYENASCMGVRNLANIKDATILDKEEQWHQHGIKEAIWELVEKPSPNKKGGHHFNLSHVWDQAIKPISGLLSHYQSSGSFAWRSVVGTNWMTENIYSHKSNLWSAKVVEVDLLSPFSAFPQLYYCSPWKCQKFFGAASVDFRCHAVCMYG